ncbi:uncharacterized protein N7483_012528 [Penicillium malachiteum]|uniref:uncharacterized protein n=1 Tax=Penicillium malachiteum TaxID=1324776 RepID=UPI002549AC69|nr:uncharacterized protein N7483_012528 [Penicillium malachiteum]KAJ5715347.1 hypothetical protein N7483_012528 [Penicillium malachiteum]
MRKNDLDGVVEFFQDLSSNNPNPIRLWCSSQVHTSLGCLLDSFLHLEITAQLNGEDMNTYLLQQATALHEAGIHEEEVTKICQTLHKRADGCFLWVSLMLNESLQVVKPSMINELIQGGVPTDFDQYYRRRIEGTDPRKRELVSYVILISHIFRDYSPNPIFRIFLACILHARRPLRLDEVRKFMAIASEQERVDIDEDKLPYKAEMMKLCDPLVKVEKVDILNCETEICTLEHSSVQSLLVEATLADGDYIEEVASDGRLIAIAKRRDICESDIEFTKSSKEDASHDNGSGNIPNSKQSPLTGLSDSEKPVTVEEKIHMWTKAGRTLTFSDNLEDTGSVEAESSPFRDMALEAASGSEYTDEALNPLSDENSVNTARTSWSEPSRRSLSDESEEEDEWNDWANDPLTMEDLEEEHQADSDMDSADASSAGLVSACDIESELSGDGDEQNNSEGEIRSHYTPSNFSFADNSVDSDSDNDPVALFGDIFLYSKTARHEETSIPPSKFTIPPKRRKPPFFIIRAT